MPGRLKVRILAGRHLPIMDRASDLTDAFVEVKFGSITYKTEVCAKSLNPLWNSEWFKFEVDDEQLQDEPLQVRVLDHDTYSAHDAIGKVYVDVDPLLDPESSHILGGWFPIFDTMHGIRGEILLMVKLELFADTNQYRQSSCGFKFVCGTTIPDCYRISHVLGFVCDLLVCEDPEYKWIEKLRTPRASNEARQRLFSKMSGELQRRIGSKVENAGGNAVVGYQQSFDIEGESGIVVRGIGTAVILDSEKNIHKTVSPQHSFSSSTDTDQGVDAGGMTSWFPTNDPISSHLRRDPNETSTLHNDFPFYTLTSVPSYVLTRLSVTVSARSVKLLEKINNQDECETRESWWNELRQEIKSHCHSMMCNAVIGYSEHASICDDVIVLSAHGTAAVIESSMFSSPFQGNDIFAMKFIGIDEVEEGRSPSKRNKSPILERADLFRVPPQVTKLAHQMGYRPSPLDGSILVPDVLLVTVDLPPYVHHVGRGTLVQARFCRSKKKNQSESHASSVTDILPFIEYELYKRLLGKVKIHGMNALFGFQSSITLGENLIVGVASGTAVYLPALPRPSKVTADSVSSSEGSFSKRCAEFTEACQKTFNLHCDIKPSLYKSVHSEQYPGIHSDRRNLFVVMDDVTDDADMEVILGDRLPPHHCYYSNLDECPGVDTIRHRMQTFSLLWRVRYSDEATDNELNRGLAESFKQAINSMWFRLRRRHPLCVVTSLRFHIAIPDDDELQIWITGSSFTLKDELFIGGTEPASLSSPVGSLHVLTSPNRLAPYLQSANEVELDILGASLRSGERKPSTSSTSFITKPLSPIFRRLRRSHTIGGRSRFDSTSSARSRHLSEESCTDLDLSDAKVSDVVEVTTMSHVRGRPIVRHIGILNVFIIRETTAVRGADEELPMSEPTHGTGSSWFVTRSLAETHALLRAHVMALGGNALTSYTSSYSVLSESLAKNEAQCLIHIIGDVVQLS